METEISRRDILKAAGGTGLAVIFGNRALALMSDEADAATVTTCLLDAGGDGGAVLGAGGALPGATSPRASQGSPS